MSIGGFGWMLARAAGSVINGSPEAVVAKIRTQDGSLLHVRRRHLAETTLARAGDGSLELDLRFKNGHRAFSGREAERIAAIVVPKVNRFGGDKRSIAEAVKQLDAVGGSEGYIDQLTRSAHVYTRARPAKRPWWSEGASRGDIMKRGATDFSKWGLFGLPVEQRLALEMALNEESERRAMRGELEELERAWREAEEIAGISDNLLVPSSVQASIDDLRRTTKKESTE